MSQLIQIKRASSAPANIQLKPGELAIGGKVVYVGTKLDDVAPGSETVGAAIRLLNADDYTSLANIAQGMTKAYVVATTPTSLTSGSITTVDNKTIALSSLKIGDYVLVKTSGVPDYFWTGTELSPIEVDKSILDGYLTAATASATYLSKTSASGTYATKTELNSSKSNLETSIATKLDKSSVKNYLTGVRAFSRNDKGLILTPGVYDIAPTFSDIAATLTSAISQWRNISFRVSGILPNTQVTQKGELPSTEGLLDTVTWYDISYLFAKGVFTSDVVDSLTSSATAYPLSARQGLILSERIEIEKTALTTLINEKISTSSIVNNLTSTAADAPLSANQGKVLNERITSEKSALTTSINAKISTSSIVNNLTSSSSTVPLSAAQGKVLNDKITSLTNNLNDLVESIDGGLWTA